MPQEKSKFLADVNIEKQIIDFLKQKEFDVKWIADIDVKMTDINVCDIAHHEKRIIITNDKDFGEIVFLQKKITSGIILLRVTGQDVSQKIQLLDKLLDRHYSKIKDHFVVIRQDKFRFIPLEVK